MDINICERPCFYGSRGHIIQPAEGRNGARNDVNMVNDSPIVRNRPQRRSRELWVNDSVESIDHSVAIRGTREFGSCSVVLVGRWYFDWCRAQHPPLASSSSRSKTPPTNASGFSLGCFAISHKLPRKTRLSSDVEHKCRQQRFEKRLAICSTDFSLSGGCFYNKYVIVYIFQITFN